MGELEKALKETRTGKAPGQDGIPSEVMKKGGQALKAQLLDLYNACWQKQLLPQDFKDALIVTIYKKKGDRIEMSVETIVEYHCYPLLARYLQR